MTKSVEIILGYVEAPVGTVTAAASILDQFNGDQGGFSLVNQSAQTGAAVAGVTSIVKLTAGFTPFLNIKTNTLAATTVMLKITAQYRTDRTFDKGDLISLVGNIAGVVGSVALLAGSGPVGVFFTAVGVGANVAGVLNSGVAESLYNSLISPVVDKHLGANTNASYPDYWIAPDLGLASLAQISAIYTNRIAVTRWNPDTQEIVLGDEDVHSYTGGGSGGGGYVVAPDSGQGPLIFPVPESPGWRVDIGPIEIVPPGGDRFTIDRYH
ncbi:hypothetical protein F3J45_23915 [Pantoea sp. Ap-967]|uniref:hypothetical protein n=1 Tax=Pantoea sp. Ap-967 TaxID=2608362 RepID=UPI001422A80A|nr:hypothetical protein [Pantoea sp. Ap-967]NIE77484.1 hypothetical protein [Pantoea sp. Ap-967]